MCASMGPSSGRTAIQDTGSGSMSGRMKTSLGKDGLRATSVAGVVGLRATPRGMACNRDVSFDRESIFPGAIERRKRHLQAS